MVGTAGAVAAGALDAGVADRLSGRLRVARQGRGMTLREVAGAAGCSESLLSKVENGKVQPSLPMLDRLARALDVGIGWLFDEPERREVAIGKAGHRPTQVVPVGAGRVVTVESVAAGGGDRAMRGRLLHLDPWAELPGESRHAGEEIGYVLAGEVELVASGRVHRLGAGDAFAFHSDLPHAFRNVGPERASVFWVDGVPLP